jgi:hypothetical protein
MAGIKNPPPLAGGGFSEERLFRKNQTLSPTVLGNGPNSKTRLHRANARELSLGMVEETIHRVAAYVANLF